MNADFSYYVLTDAESRSDRDAPPWAIQPQDITGQLCYIGYLRTGERACINVIPKYDPHRFQCICTSTVDDYHESDNGNHMEIQTMNRVYHLRRATADEINTALSRLHKKPITMPIKGYGFYGN